MGKVMMQLGLFQFKISTAAYESLTRTDEYHWAEVAQIGTSPHLQFVGKAAKTIELSGVIFPHWRGGKNQLEYLRLQAELGAPLPLISGSIGTDNLFGRWVVTSITEEASVFLNDGTPRRQGWKLSLKKYDGGLIEAISAATGVVQKGLNLPTALEQ